MKKILYASCAGLLGMLSTGPSHAGGSPPIVEHVRVAYGDLDLATPTGAESVLARIEAGASKACGGSPGPASSQDILREAKRREHRRCMIAAIDVATIELDAPLVRAAWLERGDAVLAAKAREGSAELLRTARLDVPAELSRD